jgi:hypothetical protein
VKHALIWNHRYSNLNVGTEWGLPVKWIVEALRKCEWEVFRHEKVVPNIGIRVCNELMSADLVLYTHSHAGEVRGFTGPQWFIKSTGPTQLHATLDPLGYGPYSSITYKRPSFEQVAQTAVDKWFEKKVPTWIEQRSTKWGADILKYARVVEDDYVLVIGQTLADATVAGMWFGDYLNALNNVIFTLAQITDLPIVVKLHPWTDGVSQYDQDGKPLPPTSHDLTPQLREKFESISPNIHVYTGMGSVHDFLPKARCVILCNSGAGLEALLHKKPVISWGFPEYHWVTYDLRHLYDLHRALQLDWFDERKAKQFIYWYVERYAFDSAKGALRRVRDLLADIS